MVEILRDFFIAACYHIVIFFVTLSIKDDYFCYKKRIYKIYSWERNGKFYVKYFKIKYWKDRLPQFVKKDGFSKRSLVKFTELSKEYLKKFITETCRAEWNHWMCLMSSILFTIFCKKIFYVIPTLLNFPFILIQRFNRIRLLKIYDKMFQRKDTKKTAKIGSLS